MTPGESSAATATAPPPPKPPRLPSWLRRTGGWAGRRVRAFWGWEKARFAVVRDKTQPRGKRVKAAFVGLTALGTAVFGTVTALLVLYAAVLFPFLPSVSTLRQAREVHPSIVLSADGEELTRFARNDREWVGLDEISPHVIDALIATEDRRFYEHGGIDLRRLVGAILHTLSGDREGGSTITQQLARNLFPDRIGSRVSITRKIKEALTALKIEAVYTKDEILEIYLNTVPFLYNAHGIERGAETYFGTGADDLTVPQAATLVGMLKGTSYYNPVRNPERSLRRRNLVMSLMVRDSLLTQSEYEAFSEEGLDLDFTRTRPRRSRASHFTEFVRRWAVDWADENGYNIYGDGLVIHTTLDMRLQREASRAVARWGDALQAVADVEWGRSSSSRLGTTTAPYERAAGGTEAFSHFWETRSATVDQFVRESAEYRTMIAEGATPEAALDSLRGDDSFMDRLRDTKSRLDVEFIAVDPHTGGIRAWIGSRNFTRTPFDHVADARRQPGSTFKPFLYARALEEGWTPDDTLTDAAVELPMEGGEVWRPTNSDGVTGEPMTLREALARSRNTISARLIQEVGARDVARTARAMGVNRTRLRAVPSLALGTSEVSLLEMAAGYSTIADGGVRRPTVWVTTIEDREGNVLEEFAPRERRVLDEDLDLQLIDMMRGVVTSGTGRGLQTRFGLRGDLAGKTGTSQDGADGWFMLMHPDLVAGAWVGFDDPRVTFRSSYWGEGAHNALLVVGSFFQQAVRRDLVDDDARFPDVPEEIEPSFLDRAIDWVIDFFDVHVTPDDGEGPVPTPEEEDYDAEDQDPPPYVEAEPDVEPDVEPYPDFPLPDLDTTVISDRARRALAEAMREAARNADEIMQDPPTSQEDFEELSRRAQEMARELEELERERAREAIDDLKEDYVPGF